MLTKIKLLDGLFKTSQLKGKEYLFYLDVDRLIAPCYESVAQTPKKSRYGGWEERGISGHSLGHFLSAIATMYVATGDEILKLKLDYAVSELAHVQSFDSEGYVSGFPRRCFDKVFTGDFTVERFSLEEQWVPWYSIHKIYAGLIDAYVLTGNTEALEVVIKLTNWAKKGTDNLTNEQFDKMLFCEHGGMCESLANLYKITGNKDYLDLSIRFCHKETVEALSISQDDLEGQHANTQIPKIVGAAKLYDITGDEYYKNAVTFFWKQVTKSRSYVFGGNSIEEHFGKINSEQLGVNTAETCNTYNMMKLTEYLYSWNHDSSYMDYYENALYNHILPSQDPDSGMKTYFVSTEPGHFKVYCSLDNSFWCCTGTGMENPARYGRQIYYRDNADLYVNLFIASEVYLTDKNIKLSQKTSFPEANTTKLVFEEAFGEHLSINIRVPYWAASEVTAVVNGTKTYSSFKKGYLTIEGYWKAGDVIDITLPMDLHKYTSKDCENKISIMYGPIVLAGALGKENFPETDIAEDHLKFNTYPGITVPTLVVEEPDLTKWIKPLKTAPLTFETEAIGEPGKVKLTLIPFYALHHERYTVYWNIVTPDNYTTKAVTGPNYMEMLDNITLDCVNANEQQPEVDHNVKSENSKSAYLSDAGKGYRKCLDSGYFSYDMNVKGDKQLYLAVTYWGSDGDHLLSDKLYQRNFHILIDGYKIAHEKLKENKPHSLFHVFYEIPKNLTLNKEKIEVKFASTEGNIAGKVFCLRITTAKLH